MYTWDIYIYVAVIERVCVNAKKLEDNLHIQLHFGVTVGNQGTYLLRPCRSLFSPKIVIVKRIWGPVGCSPLQIILLSLLIGIAYEVPFNLKWCHSRHRRYLSICIDHFQFHDNFIFNRITGRLLTRNWFVFAWVCPLWLVVLHFLDYAHYILSFHSAPPWLLFGPLGVIFTYVDVFI